MSANFTCPLCGLLCDDVRASLDDHNQLTDLQPACPRAEAGLRRTLGAEARPLIDGRPAELDDALRAAAELLGRARRPLIGGLSGDVAALRAALDLAERCRGVIDHGNDGALQRQLRAMQTEGWQATSLSEARNRADLVVAIGRRLFTRYPRLVQRVFVGSSQFERSRAVVLLGDWQELPAEPADAERIDLAWPQLADALGLLRILLRGDPLPNRADGLPVGALRALAARLQQSAYPVLVWAGGEFESGAPLDQLQALLRELARERRATGLSLSMADTASAVQVCAWRTGFPPGTALRPEPDYDPWRHDARRLLARGEVDAWLWLAALDPDSAPPANGLPGVVLGHPAMQFASPPAVFIPVGTPGVDHPGELFRSDGVAMPLRSLREPRHPAAATILRTLLERLA